ncbi:MAG: fructose-1,6-bisphosphatase, partial [Zetaproteobacteria bacterium]
MNELQRVAASGPHGSRPVPAVLAIAEASVSIAEALATAPIRGALGAAGEINVQGEVQQKMDVIADKFVEHALRQHQAIAAMGSEEREHLVSLHWDGDLVVLVDPLDGSSNLDVNGAVGTIFLVVARPDEGKLSDQD